MPAFQFHGGFGFACEYDVRTQVPRDEALSGCADFDEPDPVLRRRAYPRVAEVILKNKKRE